MSWIVRARPLWWLLLALVMFPLVDRAIDGFYTSYTTNETFVRGRASMRELDTHPDLDILVIGDSSARHGLDTEVLSRELGLEAWNIGTWHGALAGQAALIDSELRRGRKLKAVLLMTTENGMALPLDAADEVLLSYYLTPEAIQRWVSVHGLSLDRAADWTFALLSPSYRDGKGLESFFFELPGRSFRELDTQRALNQEMERAYLATRGQGRLPDRTEEPAASFFDDFQAVLLDSPTYRWKPHEEIQQWYDELADATDRHGVLLFHLPTPRMYKLLGHRSWRRNVGMPMRLWASEMARKHPSFRFPFADPLAMQPIDFADTADHLGESAAARMSATIAQGIRRHLTLPAEHAPTETPR